MSIVETIRQRTNTAPRTSLAFWATVCGITFLGGAALIAALAGTGAPSWLTILVVLFCLGTVLGVVVFVAVLNANSPEKLMLGEVSAVEFNKITESRAALGDSRQPDDGQPTPAIEDTIDAEIVDEQDDARRDGDAEE